MFWDQSEAAFYVRGQLNASDIVTGSINANLITSGSINANLITSGSINADLITAGTLQGRTVKANGGIGNDIRIQNTGIISFLYGGAEKAYIYADSGGNVLFGGNNKMNIVYNDDGGSDYLAIVNDSTPVAVFNDNNDLVMQGGYVRSKFKSEAGNAGISGQFGYKDDNGNNRVLHFENGILRRQGSSYI